MLDPDVRSVLDGNAFAHFASVLPDSASRSVPVWMGTDGDQVATLTGTGSRKARKLVRDPCMCVSVTDAENPFTMAQVRGRVVEHWVGLGDEVDAMFVELGVHTFKAAGDTVLLAPGLVGGDTLARSPIPTAPCGRSAAPTAS